MKKLIIYAAGGMGECNYLYLKYSVEHNNCEVIAFVDDNRHGEHIDNIPIIRYDEIDDYEFDNITVALYINEKRENVLKKLEKYANKILPPPLIVTCDIHIWNFFLKKFTRII